MAAKIEKVTFKGVEDCYKISFNGIDAIVTTKFGPRIIYFGKENGFNHLKVFDNHMSGDVNKENFVAYGGHRVWHAPEVGGRTNLPDNNPCFIETEKDSITVYEKNAKTNLTKGFRISFDKNGALNVTNFVENNSLFDVELSVWGITQFAVGGVLAVPQVKRDTGFVANRAIALWPYSKTNDHRVYYGENYITACADETKPPFKFGMTVEDQYAAYFHQNELIVKEFEFFYEAEYPNYYCNFESYFNSDIFEIESLSPLLTLSPEGAYEHTEKWYLFDNVPTPDKADEAKIAQLLEKPLKQIKG